MVLGCDASPDEIEKLGKNYPWKRPPCCPRCKKSKVWGHGFVRRFFNRFNHAIFIKRWRCPHCGLVITCRPVGFWRRFHESVDNIYRALWARVVGGRWPPDVPRQRGGHWLRSLLTHSKNNELLKDDFQTTLQLYRQKGLAIF